MFKKSKILNVDFENDFKTKKKKYYKKSYQKLYKTNNNLKKIILYILIVIIILIPLIFFINIKIKLYKNCDTPKSFKISVIIPTYNREKLISRSIQSILNQTYKNFEIIVIDDGSTDNTSIVINNIKDERIKYIKLESNKGASYARNVGIERATGDYITFQDSDDIYHYDKIEKQINNIIKNKSDFDFCKINVILENKQIVIFPNSYQEKEILKGNTYNELLKNGNFISTQSIFVKNSFIKNCTFDIDMPRLQDYELVLRILPNLSVSYTNETLVELYRQKDSISSSNIKAKKAFQRLIFKLKNNYNYFLNDEQKNYLMKYLKNSCRSCLF